MSGFPPVYHGRPSGLPVHGRLGVRECGITVARIAVERLHRHHDPPVSGLQAFEVLGSNGWPVGWAVVGRPVAPALQVAGWVEVTRCATDGTKNACSALYGACERWARRRGLPLVLSKVAKSVTFDEMHELRGGVERQGKPIIKGVSAKVLADACDFVLGLTGTPVFNYGDEMWNLCELIRPGMLGSLSEFEREWCSGSIVRSPSAFGTYLRSAGLYIRRTRTDVGRELPALTVVPVQLEMTVDPLKAIRGVAADLARRILARETEKGDRWRASGELDWQLRQATGIAKAPAVAAFVQLLVEQGEQVLLAGWHKAVYGLWKTAFENAKVRYAMFTGDESPEAKVAAAKAFETDQVQVMMMSLRSGVGLDGLQRSRCRTVVIGELDWSPQVHRQLIGRLHRDGQDKSVTAYYLLSDSGSDPVIVDVLGLKRAQAAGIEDPLNTDIAPVADHKRARALALAYLAAIGEKPPEDQDESDEGWDDLGVTPAPPAPGETVRKPSLVLTP